jgi:hypothetical protein
LSICPHNYLIPAEWGINKPILSWTDWQELVKKHPIKLKHPIQFIEDKRFQFKDFSELPNAQFNGVFGLATLLTCLITKNFELPRTWFLNHQNITNVKYFRDKIKEAPISSLTYNIIEACFSARNRETSNWIPHLKFDDYYTDIDTSKDPIEIKDIDDFLKEVKKSQFILEKFQISVQQNLPRQLIPISLEQLSRSKNIFAEFLNE